MPQLDGLRCIAAFIVVAHHTVLARFVRLGANGLGTYGVWLFFVLSGFLITGILLRGSRRPGYSVGGMLRSFYTRRALRIFPLYYAVVLGAAALGIGKAFRHDLVWYLTYLPNWRFAYVGVWGDRASSAAWSLGVEEQFYLLWPAIVLFLPRRMLGRFLVGTIVFGVLARGVVAWLAARNLPDIRAIVPTTSNLDPLAIGALLALHRETRPDDVDQRHWWTRRALATGASLVAVVAFLSVIHRGMTVMITVETLAASLVSVWLIDAAATGFAPGTVGAIVLGNPAVRYLGTISYGLYLLHQPIAWWLRAKGNVTVGMNAPLLERTEWFGIVLVTTIAVASLSWFCFEKRIQDLKQRFPYA